MFTDRLTLQSIHLGTLSQKAEVFFFNEWGRYFSLITSSLPIRVYFLKRSRMYLNLTV
jgi:hypothetical protein